MRFRIDNDYRRERSVKVVPCIENNFILVFRFLIFLLLLDMLWGCGWNEHGNLGTGDQEDSFTLSLTQGVKTCTPPGIRNSDIALAVGGAHYIVAAVEI